MTRHHLTSHHDRAGFTLIELLVVISIIALLIAILLPALAAARKTAQSVQCLSQLKQMGLAAYAYAQDNGGWLPQNTDSGNIWIHNWILQLVPYTGEVGGLYVCPTAEEQAVTPTVAGGAVFGPYRDWFEGVNYRYNSRVGSVGTKGWQFPQNSNYFGQPRRIAQFVKPSESILIVDGNLNMDLGAPNAQPFFGGFFYLASGQIAVGRHGGAENYLFVDGHAASHRAAEMDPAIFRSHYDKGIYYRNALVY